MPVAHGSNVNQMLVASSDGVNRIRQVFSK
jgi:hypothetical protein